jgi:hypothetical protein
MIPTTQAGSEGLLGRPAPKWVASVKPFWIYLSFLGGLLFALAGVAMVGSAALDAAKAAPNNPDSADQWIIVLSSALVPILIGVFLWVKGRGDQSWRVLVFDEGLVHQHRGKETVYRWEEIKEVYECSGSPHIEGVTLPPAYRCWVVNQNGDKLELYNYFHRDAQELGQMIHDRTLPRLLADAQARFHAWEPVEFGPLRVSQDGLSYRKKALAWEEVQRIVAGQARFEVKKRKAWWDWCAVLTAEIPNVAVLLALLETKVDVQRP